MSYLLLPSQINFLFRSKIREKGIRNFFKMFAPLQLIFFSFSNSVPWERSALFSHFFSVSTVDKNLASSCKMVTTPHYICSSQRCFTLAFDQSFTIMLITLAERTLWVCGYVLFMYASQHSNGLKISCELAFFLYFFSIRR